MLPQSATADMRGAVDQVLGILTKHGAEVIAVKKWDERRLAYEVKKQKRALFVLVYFEVNGRALGEIERDCNLSELILRKLITTAEHMTREEMLEADAREDIAVEASLRDAEAPAAEAAAEPASAPAEA